MPFTLNVLGDKFSEQSVFSASHRMSTAVNFWHQRVNILICCILLCLISKQLGF